MTPESPLFVAYQQPLELQSAAAEFATRAQAAFEDVAATTQPPPPETHTARRTFDVMDAGSVNAALLVAPVPDRENIGLSFTRHTSEGSPLVRATLGPEYASAQYNEKPFGSRFASIRGRDDAPYDVLHLVAITKNSALPDSRGFYVARSTATGNLIFFKVETASRPTVPPERFAGAAATTQHVHWLAGFEDAASGGAPSLAYDAKHMTAKERLALLEELEKAARVPATPR